MESCGQQKSFYVVGNRFQLRGHRLTTTRHRDAEAAIIRACVPALANRPRARPDRVSPVETRRETTLRLLPESFFPSQLSSADKFTQSGTKRSHRFSADITTRGTAVMRNIHSEFSRAIVRDSISLATAAFSRKNPSTCLRTTAAAGGACWVPPRNDRKHKEEPKTKGK